MFCLLLHVLPLVLITNSIPFHCCVDICTRCFVVIDDIWDKDSWRLIRCALQDSNHESRVVTTTRIYEVATQVGEVYKMQPLSHDESKKLLYTRIISGDMLYYLLLLHRSKI